MKRSNATILREYGPYPGAAKVNGVTWDGKQVWFATGDKLNALDPAPDLVLITGDIVDHGTPAEYGQARAALAP